VSPSLVRQCRSCCRPMRKHVALKVAVHQCDHLIGVWMTTMFLKMFRWVWFFYIVLAVACVWSVAGEMM
jgi:hypothetical protein